MLDGKILNSSLLKFRTQISENVSYTLSGPPPRSLQENTCP